ncbi:MAG: hypothetical protein ABEJ87_04395 [Candidatus Nanohalobium sp.]
MSKAEQLGRDTIKEDDKGIEIFAHGLWGKEYLEAQNRLDDYDPEKDFQEDIDANVPRDGSAGNAGQYVVAADNINYENLFGGYFKENHSTDWHDLNRGDSQNVESMALGSINSFERIEKTVTEDNWKKKVPFISDDQRTTSETRETQGQLSDFLIESEDNSQAYGAIMDAKINRSMINEIMGYAAANDYSITTVVGDASYLKELDDAIETAGDKFEFMEGVIKEGGWDNVRRIMDGRRENLDKVYDL